MPDLRLIKSDVLKLRRRPGMLAVCAGLTLGILLLAFTVITIQHGAHPLKNDPAGGLAGFDDSLQIVSLMVFLVGAIVGATAGAQDLDTGVFRDLAATGRSRTALFLSRVCGAWIVVGALAVLTIAVDVPARSCWPTAPPRRTSATSSTRWRWCSPPARSAPRSPSDSPPSSARAAR